MAAPVVIAKIASTVIPFLKKHPWLIPVAIVVPLVVGIYLFTIIGGAISGLTSIKAFGNSSCVTAEQSDKVFWDNDKEFRGTIKDCATGPTGRVYADGTWVYPIDRPVMLTSFFGYRGSVYDEDGNHYGIDFGAPPGSVILAASNGLVTTSGRNSCGSYEVVIDHGIGVSTRYYHLSSVLVDKGEEVKSGQPVGVLTTQTDNCSTGVHLHFEVLDPTNSNYRNGAVDPLLFFADAGVNLDVAGAGGEPWRRAFYCAVANNYPWQWSWC